MLRLSNLQKHVLSPQAVKLFDNMAARPNKSISAREAVLDLDMTSAVLTRRICDLEQTGVRIERNRLQHPITGKRYTRYALASVDQDYGLRNKRAV